MIDKKQLIEDLLECVNDAKDTETQITGLSMCAALMNEVLDEALIIPVVSQQSKLLPDFLYEDDGIIRTGVHGDSAVTDEWNDYLKKTGNCDCDNHIACIVCGEEKGLDGDFWERKDRE